jgi:hypothetical protein
LVSFPFAFKYKIPVACVVYHGLIFFIFLSGRRIRAIEFLNCVILGCPDAKNWLNSRITIARKIFYLNRLRIGKDRHPQIWMVTGVQLLSDVTVRSEQTASANVGANFQVPPPEIMSAAAAGLGDGSGVGGQVSNKKGGGSIVEYHHVDERVWAAQFRRLRLDFIKDGTTGPAPAREVSLHDLLDLGRMGMRNAAREVDETSHITGLYEQKARDDAAIAAEEDWEMYEKLTSASGKHALLIGGSEQALRGVQNDIKAMSDLLLRRGFDVTLCYGADATRDGIIRAWRELIQRTSSRDAVVVYYSGHGGASTSDHSGETFRIQYLLPTDICQTTETDFRGILDIELSHLVTGLTNKTHNVTVILDCCHSERAARAPVPGMRAWAPVRRKDIESHIRRLREAGLFRNLHKEGNPYSVRVVAAGSDMPAYEEEVSRDVESDEAESRETVMRNLTRQLVTEIRKLGPNKVSWDAILPSLRLHLDRGYRRQRPQVEGPRMRALFSLEKIDYWGQLGLMVTRDKVVLMGGRLADVRTGDEYAVMPPGAATIDQARQIAVARVYSVSPATADVDVEYISTHCFVPNRAIAFPLRRFRPEYGVQIQSNDASLSSRLQLRLETSRFIHEFNCCANGQPPFATIKQHEGRLVLLHQNATPTFEYPILSVTEQEDVVDDVIYQLEKLARASQVLNLAPDASNALKVDSLSIEVGRVNRGIAEPFLEGADRSFIEGQSAYIKICNGGPAKLYAAVFLVTSIGTIEWLSHGSPSGAELRPGGVQPYIPRQSSHGYNKRIKGLPFAWPASIPRGGPLKEAFVVILTRSEVDLGFLATQYRKEAPRRELNDSSGDEDEDTEDDLSFSAHHVYFTLVPNSGQDHMGR